MELNRTSKTPLWVQIHNILEKEISSGIIPAGTPLPSEAKLAQRFHVHRHTVRRGLSELRDRGLIRMEQGRGTFVPEHPVHYSVTRRTRFKENLLGQRREPGGTLLNSILVKADIEISSILSIPENTNVLLLNILRRADGLPLSLASHYFPLPRFQGMENHFQTTGSITAALKLFGIEDYMRKQTWITARMPTSEEKKVLRLPPSKPVLVVKSVNLDQRGIPIDFGKTRYGGTQVQVVL